VGPLKNCSPPGTLLEGLLSGWYPRRLKEITQQIKKKLNYLDHAQYSDKIGATTGWEFRKTKIIVII